MGTFKIDSTNGITNLSSAIQTIQKYPTTNQTYSSTNPMDLSIPTPEIELFKHTSEDFGHLYLKNAMAYNAYQENYEVVLKLYRHVGNMVYRYTSPQTGIKTNYKKTGYVAPKPIGALNRSDIGWRRDEREGFALERNINDLNDVEIISDPNDLFIRQYAIDSVSDIIDSMFFYEPGSIDPDPLAHSKYQRLPIDTTFCQSLLDPNDTFRQKERSAFTSLARHGWQQQVAQKESLPLLL